MALSISEELRKILLSIENPGRYTGGEYGIIIKEKEALNMVLSFPDLYDIGMSNQAVRLLYKQYNDIDGVCCERVFAPAPDFEEKMKQAELPLYALESGKPLHKFDLLGFSIGFELCLTSLLSILDLGGIPLRREDREESHPIIIAGGPAITNPVPFSPFLDAVYMGESEEVMPMLLGDLALLKKEKATRADLLQRIQAEKSFWFAGKIEKTERALWQGFGLQSADPLLPVPSIQTVQDHGVVEIMRGCPNGCRFCHAGVFYRPYRVKDPLYIFNEIEHLVGDCGYDNITLSSLSSGDYPEMTEMVRLLNSYFGKKGISFNLPSLRVNSLTLPLLTEISYLRKSGLTFAIETPNPEWQKGLNKDVPLDKVMDILKEARARGWNLAKFYFMLGLPVEDGFVEETEAINEYLLEIKKQTGLNINVNIGTFIPKPHTPYQWAPQLTEEESLQKIYAVKNTLKRKGIKVGFHSPFTSLLEGLITRGDERVGELFLKAYKKGARLDAWDDHLDRELWRSVFAEEDWDIEAETCRARDLNEALPWDNLATGVSKAYLKKEREKSFAHELTSACDEDCDHLCGICNKTIKVRNKNSLELLAQKIDERLLMEEAALPIGRTKVFFLFTKKDLAVYWSHLNIAKIFERALLRAGLPVKFSQGFNPKPRIEFACPLPLGFVSEGEVGAVELILENCSEDVLKEQINKVLPPGLMIKELRIIPNPGVGRKYPSVMSVYGGAEYLVDLAGQMTFETFSVLYEEYSQNNGMDDIIRMNKTDEGLCFFRIPQKGKASNIKTILRSIIGEDWISSGVRVTRLSCLKKGSKPNELISYFS